jgi:RimJ/RimL family protein N-acetyltransferase
MMIEAPPPLRVGHVIYNDKQRVADFIATLLPKGPDWHWDTANFNALGVVRKSAASEDVYELIGGVIYHNYRPHAKDIEITAAFTSSRWCLPDTMRQLLDFPIRQLGCTRFTMRTSKKRNKPARRFAEHLGFIVEGTQRRGWDGKNDLILYGLLLDQFEWLKKVKYERP